MPDFNTFSSLLRITAKYEIPTVRSRLLEAIKDAYPEAFEGVTPTKPLGEKVFGGPTPHPNEVLNLFILQGLTSALPMAYYMVARKGLNSFMDRHLPRSAALTPDVLQSSIAGLMALREIERDEVYHLVFGSKVSQPCSESKCLSRRPATLEANKRIFDHIVGSSQLGTKVLQVPDFHRDEGGNTVRIFPEFCRGCVGRWEVGHANLRRKVWAMLPSVFGLKD